MSRIGRAVVPLARKWTFRQLVCRVVVVVLVMAGYLVMHCVVTENGYRCYRVRFMRVISDKTGELDGALLFRVVDEEGSP